VPFGPTEPYLHIHNPLYLDNLSILYVAIKGKRITVSGQHEQLFSWCGVRLSPLGTSTTIWSTVPAPDDRWWVWSSQWNENWQGKPKYSEKTCPNANLSTTNPTNMNRFCRMCVSHTGLPCMASSSTMKIEVTYSSETSVDFQLATWRYNRTLQKQICWTWGSHSGHYEEYSILGWGAM
jgi:hypothetical protein